ncbi:unnamed protein product [Commensalibacter communis]|uniref:tetratricopeptide repeat protein n=1 Tax=Commensalibacter communis TaxID=2972786 RepID=UPI0022FF5B34|nr:tetratricopeptide repeat protein [Commensalibacter communis]CAI3940620.1 unnamed protein product [Commensalibacter communis]
MNIFKKITLFTIITVSCFPLQSFATDTPKTEISSLEQKANQGSAEAQYDLGQLYEKTNNKGVSQDYFKAVELYTKAANQGLASAQYSLGKLYEESRGVPQDCAKAVEWYTKAANQGLIEAQYSLGKLYEQNHSNVSQDYVKAVEWYTKAANQKIVLNKENITSYLIPQNSYNKLKSLLSSSDFKKSQDILKIKEYLKQDCLNKHQNSCDFYKELNN